MDRSAPSQFAERSGPAADPLELLADLGRDFAATLDVDATLASAVERITRHLNAAGGALFLLEDEGRVLRCRACSGATQIQGLTVGVEEGIVGRCVRNNAGEIVRDVAQDANFFKGVDRQTGYTTRSILCAPMSVKDERIGAIELINKIGPDARFEDADLNLLKALSTSAGLAILNARMAAKLVEQERLRRELELAAEIQRSLLPPEPAPDSPIWGLNYAARTVSGDFYDFFELTDGRICFSLGDVSGKGMNAALLMAKSAALFRCLGKTMHDPGELFGVINREIFETATHGMFVTLVGGIFDPRTGVVRFTNAGHEPPFHHRRDGTFVPIPADSPPLGLVPEEVFEVVELRLDGGRFYVFTDGLTEGYVEGGGVLGADGVQDMLVATRDRPVRERLEAVVGRVKRSGVPLRDDVTILAIEDRPRAR